MRVCPNGSRGVTELKTYCSAQFCPWVHHVLFCPQMDKDFTGVEDFQCSARSALAQGALSSLVVDSVDFSDAPMDCLFARCMKAYAVDLQLNCEWNLYV